MKKKLCLISLVFLPFVSNGAVEFDLVKGVDMTATNYRPASLYNQLVDNATIGATNKGGIIRQTTTPNVGDNPRYTNFIYISNSVPTAPTLMLWNGSGWIPGIVGANTVGSIAIQDSAVTAGKIAGSAVFGTNIAGNTIQGTNLADGAVYGDKIANNGIWQGKFQPLAIRGIDITNRTIWNTNLVLSSITSNEMSILSIPTPMLTDGAVTTAKIATTNVTRDVIRNDAIGSLQITNLAVSTNHITTNITYNLAYAWGVCNAGGTFLKGYNISSVTRISAGRYTFNFINPVSDTNYACSVAALENAGGNQLFTRVLTNATTAVTVQVTDNAGVAADRLTMIHVFGW